MPQVKAGNGCRNDKKLLQGHARLSHLNLLEFVNCPNRIRETGTHRYTPRKRPNRLYWLKRAAEYEFFIRSSRLLPICLR